MVYYDIKQFFSAYFKFNEYHFYLLQQGAVRLAIWVPSVTTQSKELEVPDTKSSPRGYSVVSLTDDKDDAVWRRTSQGNDIELPVIENFSGHSPIDVDIYWKI